ncbi:MAG: FISUMP domain-containing protein [Bacteroidetes bacterium]|nr:FISUMP domain-containing protein [Bacteroidota bacterium]MDA1177105.1 FISUMP domain-containing protein [Bacteroidota bacterium]
MLTIYRWNSSTTTGAPGNDQSLNNNSGFNAFPLGNRLIDGVFINQGKYSNFWSSSEASANNTALARYLYFDYIDYHFNSFGNINYGFSVRFVRD